MAWDATLCELPVVARARIVCSRFESGDTKLGVKFSLAGLAFHGRFTLISEAAYQLLRKVNPEAIEGNQIRPVKFGDKFRVEHIIPTEIVFQHLLKRHKDGALTTQYLEKLILDKLDCAIITKEEDDRLTKLKLRNNMSKQWSGLEDGDPLDRYKLAGIELHRWDHVKRVNKDVQFVQTKKQKGESMFTIEEVVRRVGGIVQYRKSSGPNTKDQIIIAQNDDYQFLFKYWRAERWEFCIWAKEGNEIEDREKIRNQWRVAMADWNADGDIVLDFDPKNAGRNKGARITPFGIVVSFVPQRDNLNADDVFEIEKKIWRKIVDEGLMPSTARIEFELRG